MFQLRMKNIYLSAWKSDTLDNFFFSALLCHNGNSFPFGLAFSVLFHLVWELDNLSNLSSNPLLHHNGNTFLWAKLLLLYHLVATCLLASLELDLLPIPAFRLKRRCLSHMHTNHGFQDEIGIAKSYEMVQKLRTKSTKSIIEQGWIGHFWV